MWPHQAIRKCNKNTTYLLLWCSPTFRNVNLLATFFPTLPFPQCRLRTSTLLFHLLGHILLIAGQFTTIFLKKHKLPPAENLLFGTAAILMGGTWQLIWHHYSSLRKCHCELGAPASRGYDCLFFKYWASYKLYRNGVFWDFVSIHPFAQRFWKLTCNHHQSFIISLSQPAAGRWRSGLLWAPGVGGALPELCQVQ